jgi:DNA-binding helix-hairpin-helix protein with protein kinase domain
MIVYDSRKAPITLGPLLHRGGEGSIHPVDGQAWLLAKVYATPREGYEGKLLWMKRNPPAAASSAAGHAPIAWPRDLLYDGRGQFIGYVMPRVRNAVPLLEVFNPRRRAQTLPAFNWRYLHRAARNLAAAVKALHARDYVIGDLNEGNVLVTPAALVTLIDTDSFQVQEHRQAQIVFYPCPVGKPEYTPPELQGKTFNRVVRGPEHDLFGLAVLIFQLLMEGSHPFRSQWLGQGDPPPVAEKIARGWFPYLTPPPGPIAPPTHTPALETLHPSVADLVRRCFVDGHTNKALRPLPEAWEQALAEAERSIVECASGHMFAGHQRACPRCGGRGRAVAATGSIPTQPQAAATGVFTVPSGPPPPGPAAATATTTTAAPRRKRKAAPQPQTGGAAPPPVTGGGPGAGASSMGNVLPWGALFRLSALAFGLRFQWEWLKAQAGVWLNRLLPTPAAPGVRPPPQ